MGDPASVSALLSSMSFRCIGPPRGGRVVAVTGDPVDPATFYFGAVAGGIWKTTDAGTTWECVSDGFLRTSSVGALEVAPSARNVVYAGMGETTIRTDVSYGDGVYRSTDGGRTWKQMGLAATRHIGKIVVHPRNADVVYVAALGHAFGPNPERGVYRSRDGGETWSLVLHKSDRAGAADISMDVQNPGILYASIWQARRMPWKMESGGEDSGLWRTMDGGETWTEISRANGLPASGLLGKIGVAASPARAGRVWALVEHKEEGGLYRSDNFGESWQLVCGDLALRRRPWYYMHVVADPQDADTVYVSNLSLHRSTDGGVTFTEIPTPHGDNHGLWIDPRNNRRMIQSNDGGANISLNGGDSFTGIYNQLTAQFYHIDTDNRFPYRVYATQQDNSSISVPSDTVGGAITMGDCYIAGTGESGYVAVDPKDDDVVFVGAVGSSPGGLGALQRYDRKTDQIQLVNVWPQIYGGDIPLASMKYRVPWTFPVLFSPHNPNLLYTCANVALRSTDNGHSWEPFSPDLTRNDPAKQQPSGGEVTLDSSAAEHYCTIYSFRESPLEAGVFWAGSDDGLVHLSRDNGATWKNVTPAGLPEWAWVRTVEPSPHDPATCYLAATRYKLDDTSPYLFVTRDYGNTWQRITNGIPADDYTRVIRADPNCAGVLYAGTETGLYVSLNDGNTWNRWGGNFPVCPVYDLTVKGTDLVVATHGRSAWILDDLTPLYQWADSVGRSASSHDGKGPLLLAPRASYRIPADLFSDWVPQDGRVYGIGTVSSAVYLASKNESGQQVRKFLDAGQGAPRGATVTYILPDNLPSETSVKLEFLDSDGVVVRTFAPKPAGYDKLNEKEKSLNSGPWITTKPGVNRFLWNLRAEGVWRLAGNKTAGELNEGPFVLPGRYTVRLTVGDEQRSAEFEARLDPRVRTSPEYLREQYELLLTIRNTVSHAYRQIARLRDVREQVQGWRKRLADKPSVVEKADALVAQMDAIEDVLILPGDQKDTYHLTSRPRLNEAIASLLPVLATADARPTAAAAALVAEYAEAINKQCAALDALLADQGAALSRLIAEQTQGALIL